MRVRRPELHLERLPLLRGMCKSGLDMFAVRRINAFEKAVEISGLIPISTGTRSSPP